MDEKHDYDKVDEVMLPGFRFHPTDEELVGFYLKRKIQQRTLSIELIKQLDIYKYDPWDLPKEMATTGEKEWYFYCPRDRKYRNSTRPNRVTGGGFWKATGTDRPIYASEGSKCIGLKKSLVFYKGRAAKGIKTDWMMHEFRLPSLTDSTALKRPIDKNLPPNDAWAICRIFKKTNSMAQKALSHSWVSPVPETTQSDVLTYGTNCTQFSPENLSCTTDQGRSSAIQYCSNKDFTPTSSTSFSPSEFHSYEPMNPAVYKPTQHPISNGEVLPGFASFPPLDMAGSAKYSVDVASLLLNLSPALLGDVSKSSESIDFGGTEQRTSNGFSTNLVQEMQGNMGTVEEDEDSCLRKSNQNVATGNQWGTARSVGYPFDLPDAWKTNFPWESPPCPSEMSTSYSTNKCYI
ncbi:hypothetical protein C5167_033049 [Papaver somniferum]|uniref:NAC domain-containing protein n=1 Tax=Papaver somniferum TaxID=3469 RepID=A0A4Y7KAM1_PAPSO|nr:hypothetical protein C5167_033049 [Papaver somniferum]